MTQRPDRYPIARCCAAALLAASLLAASLTGCGSPLEPDGDVSITGLGPSLAVGEQTQLHATDTGGPTDVTTLVRWATTTATCLVTPDGLLTARSTGECAVTATFGGVTATATTQIGDARAFTIRGTVSDLWAEGSPIVAGATVTITSGAQAGRSTQSDATGAFTLARVPNGPIDLRAEAPGLEPKTVQVSPESPQFDFALSPLMQTVTWNRASTAALESGTFSMPFDTHHRGPFTMTMTTPYSDCAHYDLFTATIKPLTTIYSVCGPGSARHQGTLVAGHYELTPYLISVSPGTRTIELIVPQ